MLEAEITEFVHSVVHADGYLDEPEFIVLPRAEAEGLEELERAISVATWGELQEKFPHLYQEVCRYANHEADDPPTDDTLFDPYEIPAHADGDWPESWRSIQFRTLPPGLPAQCGGDVGATLFNGIFVQFPASAQEAVLTALTKIGHRCTEEQELLSSLVTHHFV